MASEGAIPLLVRMMCSERAPPGAREAAAGAISNLACIKVNQVRERAQIAQNAIEKQSYVSTALASCLQADQQAPGFCVGGLTGCAP